MKKLMLGLVFILIYPFFLTFQGVDVTDFGFSLANYDGFFSYPESVSFFFVNYLTNFIGAIWLKLFGNWLGAWSIEFLAILVYGMTFYIIWKLYSEKIPLIWIFIAFYILILFSFKEHWFYYNTLTMFLYVLLGFSLYQSAITYKRFWLYVSGILMAIASFARFPNILSIGMAIIIIYQGYRNNLTWRNIIQQLVWMILGLGSGIIVMICVMFSLGHIPIYLTSLKELVGLASTQSHHGSRLLISIFIQDHIDIVHTFIFLVIPVFIILLFGGLVSTWILKKKVPFLGAGIVILIGTVFGVFFIKYVDYRIITEASVGSLYIGLIFIFFETYKKNRNLHLSAIIGLFVVVLVPLGSNNGINNASFGWFFGFIVLLWGIYDISIRKNIELVVKHTLGIIAISLLIYGFNYSYHHTYRDAVDRAEMTYSLQVQGLQWLHTTKDRAQVINELNSELRYYVRPGDVLFLFDELPLFHYTTHTKAYLWNPWPTLYEPSEFKEQLIRAKEEQGLPVLVRNKVSVSEINWPNYPYLRRSPRYDANQKTVQIFINENDYQKVWENRAFEIWLPPRLK